jgi:hypothetical protein
MGERHTTRAPPRSPATGLAPRGGRHLREEPDTAPYLGVAEVFRKNRADSSVVVLALLGTRGVRLVAIRRSRTAWHAVVHNDQMFRDRADSSHRNAGQAPVDRSETGLRAIVDAQLSVDTLDVIARCLLRDV